MNKTRSRRTLTASRRALGSLLCLTVLGLAATSATRHWVMRNRSASKDDRALAAGKFTPAPSARALPVAVEMGTESEAPAATLMAKAVVGHWQDDFRGKRYLTLNQDGTGQMLVFPDGLGRALFARRLRFDLEWSLRSEVLTLIMTGGEPESKVQVVCQMFGDRAEYAVAEVSDSRLLLFEAEADRHYDWRRVSATEIPLD